MNNYIIAAGALGIGYLIYKNTDNENIGKNEVLEAVPEAKPREKKIEVTKIGLLPAEDKKALIMNLKNAKSYSSTFAIVTAVVGGVFTSFYISKKMIIVIYEYYKYKSTMGFYGFPEISFREIMPPAVPEFLVHWFNRNKKPTFSEEEPVDLEDPPENKKLDEIEENNINEIKDIQDMPDEDPMLSQGNIPLESFKGGTVFIKPKSEIKIEENVKIEESMQTANINKIDNITIGVEKSEESEEEKLENILNEIDNMITIINNIPNSENKLLNNRERYTEIVRYMIDERIALIKILNTMREELKNKSNFPKSNIKHFLTDRMESFYRPMWISLSSDEYIYELEDYEDIAIKTGYYESDFYKNMEKLIKNLHYFANNN